jgi:putative membrane protein
MILELFDAPFQKKISKEQVSIGLILSMHLFGAIIIGNNAIENFILLTPLNLLASLGLILWNHTTWNAVFLRISLFCFFAGLIAEMIGTNTGLIFGTYDYGKSLGFKVLNVPLMIGVNWLMLIYAAVAAINELSPKLHFVWKALFSAILMVGLDLLIEPVAMKHDFWYWKNNVIPFKNYVDWFFLSFILLLIFHRFLFLKNKTAIALFGSQLLFFLILNLLK